MKLDKKKKETYKDSIKYCKIVNIV